MTLTFMNAVYMDHKPVSRSRGLVWPDADAGTSYHQRRFGHADVTHMVSGLYNAKIKFAM
ncbi:hypothetical protein DSY14_10495 [Nocardiopsis sp. MG754419]|nr:hypothetical protein [Nocardiopsis sp. MG754419]